MSDIKETISDILDNEEMDFAITHSSNAKPYKADIYYVYINVANENSIIKEIRRCIDEQHNNIRHTFYKAFATQSNSDRANAFKLIKKFNLDQIGIIKRIHMLTGLELINFNQIHSDLLDLSKCNRLLLEFEIIN